MNTTPITIAVMTYYDSNIKKLIRQLTSLIITTDMSPLTEPDNDSITDFIKRHRYKITTDTRVHVVMMVDGISGYKYKDLNDLLNRLDREDFNRLVTNNNTINENLITSDAYYLYLSNQLKLHIEDASNEIVNDLLKRHSNIDKVLEVYNEFHKLYPNSSVNGTLYHTNLMINRNIYLQLHRDSYRMMIDDDDISASLTTRQRYIREGCNEKYITRFKVVSNEVHKRPDYRIGVWSLILPPNKSFNFNVKEVSYEDSSFINTYCKYIVNSKYYIPNHPIYYYLESSMSCYSRYIRPYEYDIIELHNSIINQLPLNDTHTDLVKGKYYYNYNSKVDTTIGLLNVMDLKDLHRRLH